jgi:hypothetical protein
MADADPDADLCKQCGHPRGRHKLSGYAEPGEVPREGWVMCPADGCECHSTWSTQGGSAEGAAAAYQRFLAERDGKA